MIRRTLVLATATCLAAASLGPALADPFPVTVTTTEGIRQFAVQNLDGSPLTAFAFGAGGQQPFKTVVTDTDRSLSSPGYQVDATMSNLYLVGADSALDYATTIPSGAVRLGYGVTPLVADALSLPVASLLDIDGTLGNCTSSAVRNLLGIDLGALLSLTQLLLPIADQIALLTGPLGSVCQALAGVTAPVDTTVDRLTTTVSSLQLPLGDLPFALTGAQERGAFTRPSFATGTAGAGDTAGKAAAAAASQTPTSKRIMAGTPGVTPGLLSAVTSALTPVVGTLPLVSQDGTGALLSLDDLLAGLSGDGLATLVSALGGLGATQQLALLNQLVGTVLPFDVSALSTVSGRYTAFPILEVAPSTAVPGTYSGTLTVDFFQP